MIFIKAFNVATQRPFAGRWLDLPLLMVLGGKGEKRSYGVLWPWAVIEADQMQNLFLIVMGPL